MNLFLEKIASGKTLNFIEAKHAMECLCSPDIEQEKAAAFLAILHTRGETLEELFGFVSFLKRQVKSIQYAHPLLDTCGTGGDFKNTFNIPTASALLLGSLGVKVAKHGGRAVSSPSGSSDVLLSLGVRSQKSKEEICDTLDKMNFVFLYAPYFNTGLQHVSTLRQLLRIRTCFNFLGPPLNPLNVTHQILGVYSSRLILPMAKLLQELGVQEAMVIHSEDGMDEISINAKTQVAHLKNNKILHYEIDPKELGYFPSPQHLLAGGCASKNASIISKIFSGEKGAHRDIVTLNAAAGLLVRGEVSSLAEGQEVVNQSIDRGCAYDYLKNLKRHHQGNKNEN